MAVISPVVGKLVAELMVANGGLRLRPMGISWAAVSPARPRPMTVAFR